MPPQVTWLQDAKTDIDSDSSDEESPAGDSKEATKRAVGNPRGMGPVSWSIERLRSEWGNLNMSDQVRVARYGGRQARVFVLKLGDKLLHSHLVANSRISSGEVAMLAGMASADPKLLDRIASNREWLKNTQVARNLVCNPKMILPKVVKLLDYLPTDELLRLSKTGKVRAPIKREIIRKVERRGGRR